MPAALSRFMQRCAADEEGHPPHYMRRKIHSIRTRWKVQPIRQLPIPALSRSPFKLLSRNVPLHTYTQGRLGKLKKRARAVEPPEWQTPARLCSVVKPGPRIARGGELGSPESVHGGDSHLQYGRLSVTSISAHRGAEATENTLEEKPPYAASTRKAR